MNIKRLLILSALAGGVLAAWRSPTTAYATPSSDNNWVIIGSETNVARLIIESAGQTNCYLEPFSIGAEPRSLDGQIVTHRRNTVTGQVVPTTSLYSLVDMNIVDWAASGLAVEPHRGTNSPAAFHIVTSEYGPSSYGGVVTFEATGFDPLFNTQVNTTTNVPYLGVKLDHLALERVSCAEDGAVPENDRSFHNVVSAGGSAKIVPTFIPGGIHDSVAYSIEAAQGGVMVSIGSLGSGEFCVIADKNSGAGAFTLVGRHGGCEARLDCHVGCACGGCAGGECSPGTSQTANPPSDGNMQNQVVYDIGAGQALPSGRTVKLVLDRPRITPEVYTPAALEVSGVAGDAETIRDGTGALRQVATDTGTADILVESASRYRVRAYRSANVGPKSGNGLYTFTGPEEAEYVFEDPDAGAATRLSISRIIGAETNSLIYSRAPDGALVRSYSGPHVAPVSYASVLSTNELGRISHTVRALDAAQTVLSQRETVYEPAPWGGYRRASESNGIGPEERATTYTWNDPHRRIATETGPDGRTMAYTYDPQGRVTEERSTWLDGHDPAEIRAQVYPNAAALSPSLETVALGSTLVSKTWRIEDTVGGLRRETVIRAADPASTNPDDPAHERTVTLRYPWDLATATHAPADGRVHSVVSSSGALELHTYETGDYAHAHEAPAACVFVLNPLGEARRETVLATLANQPSGVPGWSRRRWSVRDEHGRLRLEGSDLLAGPGDWDELERTSYDLDDTGRPMRILGTDGSREDRIYGCCGLDARIARDGVRESYEYDAWHRRTRTIHRGLDGAPGAAGQDRAVAWTHDPLGRTLTETRTGGDLSLLVTTNAYYSVGRMTWTRDAQGIESTVTYDDANRKVTSIRAGVTNEVVRYRDGQTKSVTVNGILRATYTYGVESDGRRWTRVTSGPGGENSPAWEKSWTDGLGRTVRAERPGFGGATLVAESFYDAQGRLIRSTQTGQPDTLYAYNELGEPVAQAADLNGNGVMDYAGPDRVVSNDVVYAQADGIWWRESRSYAYPETAAQLIATRRERLTGLGATGDLGALASETVGLDLLGNETVSRTWVDRAARKVTQATDVPDSTLDAAQTSINGLVLTNATAGGVVATYAYDDLGRPIEARTDSDGGARSVRQTTQYNALGQVAWIEDGANNRTAFAYDAARRQTAVTNALGQVTTTLYDALGNVTHVTGATYPVSYGYDDWNRMVWMKTYRDENGAGDLTRWEYDLATGLVTNKVYADGKGTAYAYTADGKLSRRTWARGIATDYGYTASGELETVDYSDATPDVTYTHDRLGRPVTITDVLGTRTNVYDVATLALAQEKLPNGLTLFRSQDVLGRASGVSMPDYAVEYGYDAYGRFGSVTSSVSSVSSVVNYSYIQGSDILAGWSSNAGMSFHRTYEAHRDLISAVTNAWNGTAVSSFAYTNDEIGRRTARTDNGSVTNLFGYNLRSEVSSALMGANAFGYQYDPIGNRLTATNNAAVTTYAANELNQYTNIVSGASVTPTYDDDGNMATYGPWAFAWDGENRLIGVSSNSVAVVTNAYDYASRRVAKTSQGVTRSYQYDGWNLIRETAGTNVTHYVWGLDLSQSLQGAGGVGGLLETIRDGAAYFPAYDANGNVTDYANASGSIVARYEYDPFGGLTHQTGALADQFVYRFSTKYWDAETALYYYGYRYYSPVLGRWLNRDWIEERGSPSLYMMCWNDVLLVLDVLGANPYFGGDPTIAAAGAGFGCGRRISTPDYSSCGDPNSRFYAFSGIMSRPGASSVNYMQAWAYQQRDLPYPNNASYPEGSDPSQMAIWNHPSRSDIVGFPFLLWNSEGQLDDEADRKAAQAFKVGQFCGGGAKKKIRLLMIAPKTTDANPSSPCCDIDIHVLYDPNDICPNQSFSNGTQRNWGDIASEVIPVDLPGPISNHSMPDGPTVPIVRPYERAVYHMAPNTVTSFGTTVERGWERAGGDVNMTAMLNAWLDDANNDYVFVCHSQGCNIALRGLKRACCGEK